MAALRLAPLLWLLQAVPAAVAESAFPSSFVLLPLDSFSNASMVAGFSCAPTYATAACSGHGSCLLLLDAALPASSPFLSASSARPIPAASLSSASLNPADFDSFDMLPAAVCACDALWTGRGDYINHFALDGDCCGVSLQVVRGLSGSLLLLFFPLLLLSLLRSGQWLLWLQASLLPADATSRSPHSNQPVERLALGALGHQGSGWRSAAHLAHVLRTHCTDITFVHPLCSLLHSGCVLAFLALRIGTDQTVGPSWLMGGLMYAQMAPAIIALCANASTRLRVVSALLRSRADAVSTRRLLLWTNRSFFAACVYATVTWLLVLFAYGKQGSQQQLYAILLLAITYWSDLSTGVVLVAATFFIVRALVLGLERLSAEQRNERLTLAGKLRHQATNVVVVIVANVVGVALLLAVPAYRQPGLPYFALLRFFFTASQTALRFVFVLPPKRTASVAPSVLTSFNATNAMAVSIKQLETPATQAEADAAHFVAATTAEEEMRSESL